MRGIIIEGPDGAGKSTLLAKLAQDLDRCWVHTGGANQSIEELDQKCREQGFHLTHGSILDRCTFISDPIYKNALGQQLLRAAPILRARLWSFDPVIVYCKAGDANQMLHAIVDAKKDHKPPEYLAKVKESYPRIVAGYDREMELLQAEGFTVIRYDWRTDDYHTLKELLKQCAD